MKNCDIYPEYNLESVKKVLMAMGPSIYAGSEFKSFSVIANSGKLSSNQLYMLWYLIKSDQNDKYDPALLKQIME